ncbi:MAG: MFS transporter [Bacteroidota bacterium]
MQERSDEKHLDDTATDSGKSNKRWHVTGILCLGMVNAYFDRVALSVALPIMITTVDLTNTQIGIALGAFFWSYTLLQVPGGILVDRFGVRKPYIISYLIWSLASAGTAFTMSLGFLLVMRIILGVGEAMVAPASMRYIRMHFDEKSRGNAVGLYMTGTKLGPAFGFPLAGFLISTFNWQVMFVIMGLGGLVFLIPWMMWVKKDDPAALPKEKQQEVAARAETDKSKWESGSMRDIMWSPALWGILLGTFCYMYFVYYSMTWMPLYFNEQFGMSIKEMAWYPGVAFGGMALVIWIGGYFADWFIDKEFDAISVRKGFTILGFILGSTQTIAVYIENETVMLTLAVVSMWGLGLATANYWALTHTLMPGGRIGTIVGVQNTAANLAGIIAPTLTGFLIDATGSFDAPIKAVGILLGIGIFGYTFLVREKYAPVNSEKSTSQ